MSTRATPARGGFPVHGRLLGLMVAGLVDSLFLSMAWTVLILHITAAHGLVAAGLCSTAMLVGVALSAPTAGAMSRRLNGRQLLRSAAAVEAVLRLGVFGMLFSGAPLWALAGCVTAMNVVAWTGYAGMRAEVAAVSAGATGLTWYGTIVASVEAVGVAMAALLPVVGGGFGPVMAAVTAAYVLALVPTAVVAGGSRVPRAASAPRRAGPRRRPTVSWPAFRGVVGGGSRVPRAAAAPRRAGPRRPPTVSLPALSGVLLMVTASAPTMLSVALAAQLHGRASVGFAAVAFTVGSLAAPMLVARIQARLANQPLVWVLCGVGMVAGWVLAPYSVLLMCVAQFLSGLCMTSLEGLLDAKAAELRPDEVTAALARATAGRALGSAAGTAVLPLVVAGVGLQQGVGSITVALLAVAAALQLLRGGRRVRLPVRPVPVVHGVATTRVALVEVPLELQTARD